MMPRPAGLLSVMALGAVPLFAGMASAEGMPAPVPGHDLTLQAIAACGVAAAGVRITYEDLLQSDLVRIDDLGGSDEARFRCLRNAVHPAYIVDVSDAPQREAYQAFAQREDDKDGRAEARSWLKTAGLLDRVPRYDPRKGVKAFARALEAACSIRPGSALETYGASGIAIRPSLFGDFMATTADDQLACLLRMGSASDAREHDITFAFVGNAAASEGRR